MIGKIEMIQKAQFKIIIKGDWCRIMIVGTGIDIVELTRIEEAINRSPRFSQRILSERELIYYQQLQSRRKVEFLAGRFAAKEAFAKAVGSGIGGDLSWQDIEILADNKGKPIVVSKKTDGQIHLSISHSREYAIANVIIEL